jgi:hypothetical protein
MIINYWRIKMGNEKAELYKKISAVMGELQRIPKNGKNKEQNYAYATAEDIKNETRKAMAKYNLSLLVELPDYEIIEITSRSGTTGTKLRGNIHYTLCCGDTGEIVTMIMPNEAIDWQDKSFSKLYTVGLKYFLINTFQISTGDEDDTDGASGVELSDQKQAQKRQVQKPAPAPAPQPAAAPEPAKPATVPPRPWDAATLKERITASAAKLGNGEEADPTRRKVCVIALAALTGHNDNDRHAITSWLFGEPSTKNLKKGQVESLILWIGQDNQGVPSEHAIKEAAAVLVEYREGVGQMDLLRDQALPAEPGDLVVIAGL